MGLNWLDWMGFEDGERRGQNSNSDRAILPIGQKWYSTSLTLKKEGYLSSYFRKLPKRGGKPRR